jgi:hypothetical protein
MINFLASPAHFNRYRTASISKQQLAEVAFHQYRYANTMLKKANWLKNVFQSGVAVVKGLATKVMDVIHSITQFFFVQMPVVRLFTKVFQKIAYNRLLKFLFRSYSLGYEDMGVTRQPKSEAQVKSLIGDQTFYEAYLLGYNGGSNKDLSDLAMAIAKRELGTRTIRAAIAEVLSVIDLRRSKLHTQRLDKKIGDEDAGLGNLVEITWISVSAIFKMLVHGLLIYKFGLIKYAAGIAFVFSDYKWSELTDGPQIVKTLSKEISKLWAKYVKGDEVYDQLEKRTDKSEVFVRRWNGEYVALNEVPQGVKNLFDFSKQELEQ